MTHTSESKSWDEVVMFYRELVDIYSWDFGAMQALVESIASSPYARSLFPATSIHRLCIARTRTIYWWHAMLMIDYAPTDERFDFTYFDTQMMSKPWVTSCPAVEGLAQFDWLMNKRLRWLKDSRPAIDDD